MKLNDKIAIVTGAGSGMGEATGRLFASEGATVVIADKDEAKANEVADSIRSAGGKASALAVNVTNEEQVCRIVSRVVKEYGTLDILINCVGIAQFKPTLEITLQEWQLQIDVNLTGVFL